MSTELAQSAPQTVKDFLALPAYKARFGEVLGQRAPQFMASLVAISSQSNLARCEPRSVIASAMVAATLDLPIEKSLGFAHVVPYGDVAQFQMAAKGYVQLALRSAQYQRMNAKPINAEAFDGYDEVGEPRINWELLDETKPAVGYVVAWKLINGFTKIAYWTKSKVEAHAAQFSQAYKKKKMDSPWFTNFDKMALKTVVMNELRAWGILSVQMQTALKHDMASQKDVDAEPEYLDGDTVDISSESSTPATEAPRPPPPPRVKKGASAVNPVPTQADAARAVAVAESGARGTAMEAEIIPPKTAADVAIAQGITVAKELLAEKASEIDAAKAASTELPPPEVIPEPAKSTAPRTALEAKEKITATVTIQKLYALMINIEGKPTPSVQAKVSGPFIGDVYHFGGAKTEGDSLVPSAPWKEGASVALVIYGRLNAKSGKVMTVVESIVEAAPETAMDVG